VCGNLGSVSTIIAAITPTSVSLYTPSLTTTVFSSRIRNGSTYAVYVSDGSGPLPASTISKFTRDNFCGYAVHSVFLTLFILFFLRCRRCNLRRHESGAWWKLWRFASLPSWRGVHSGGECTDVTSCSG